MHKQGKQQLEEEAGSLLVKEPDMAQSQDPGVIPEPKADA